MTRDAFAELRARLDVRDLAEAEGLSRRGRHFDCPACDKPKHLKAMSRDGEGWFCVACEASGDAVDLLAAVRRLTPAEALRVACALAGLDPDGRASPSAPPPPRRPPPAPPVLDPLDGANRLRALRVAEEHYRTLAELVDDDGRAAWATREHLAGACGLSREAVAETLGATAIARAYLARRLARAPRDRWPAHLLGVAGPPRSGLREFLEAVGGAALVDAARRAGVLRWDASEALAGRLVYIWRRVDGRPVYLTGRAVPELVADTAPKVLALPVHGAGEDPARGVPRPGVPFGLDVASARAEGPVWVVEGELQAVAAIAAGKVAVATGGVTRTRAEDLVRAGVSGRRVIVRFDLERDPSKQAATDARAEDLARAIGGRWSPPAARAATLSPSEAAA